MLKWVKIPTIKLLSEDDEEKEFMKRKNLYIERRFSPILTLFFIGVIIPFYYCYPQKDDILLQDIFSQANLFYEEKEYDKAIAEYKKILEKKVESGNLYYNLGNCYFKKGRLGKAILNYEKALRLIPRDRDLEANYKYACSLIRGNIPRSRRGFTFYINNLFKWFTIDELTIFSSFIYLCILAVIIGSLYIKWIKRYRGLILVFLGGIFIFILWGINRKVSLIQKEAIVIAEKVEVKFEPLEHATTYFTAYEGMKLRVMASNNGWQKVKRADGKKGWVRKERIEIF